jgi:hypothetical protein
MGSGATRFPPVLLQLTHFAATRQHTHPGTHTRRHNMAFIRTPHNSKRGELVRNYGTVHNYAPHTIRAPCAWHRHQFMLTPDVVMYGRRRDARRSAARCGGWPLGPPWVAEATTVPTRSQLGAGLCCWFVFISCKMCSRLCGGRTYMFRWLGGFLTLHRWMAFGGWRLVVAERVQP